MTPDFITIVTLSGGILGAISFVIACICVSIVVGMARATHSVQYVPFDNNDALKGVEKENKILQSEEEKLFNMVGRKKKTMEETIIPEVQESIDQITESDIKF